MDQRLDPVAASARQSVMYDKRRDSNERGFTRFTFCAQFWTMERDAKITGIGGIYAILSEVSSRPRYAFLVLQLVAELADRCGQAGPFVSNGGEPVLLREWLCTQLLPMSEQSARRAALRARVMTSLAEQLTGDPDADAARIDRAVAEQVLAAGRANVSRATSDLVRAGLVTRHYAGYATNHQNRGGRRHAVYVVRPQVLRLLRRTGLSDGTFGPGMQRQGELFAA